MATAKIKPIDVRELLKVGAHFGHKTSHWNPKMKPYIHSKRGGIYIIDLIQTTDKLEAAAQFLHSQASEGNKILFVGTKRHVRPVVKEAAERAGMPYITERWFGGMLTNFSTISTRIARLRKLEAQLESGELASNYSKRELGEYKEEALKLNEVFGGIKGLTALPQALVVTDVRIDKIAVQEANRLNIPVVGVADTNSDPDGIGYIIPANDDAVSTIAFIANYLAEVIHDGVLAATSKAKAVEISAPDEMDQPPSKTKKTTAK